MGLENIRDESIKKLAIMLRQNGLAASDTEAERMANEMSSTSNRVQQAYDDQDSKDEKQSINEEKDGVEQKSSESQLDSDANSFDSENVINEQKAFIDSSYKEILDSNKTVNELMEENSKQSVVEPVVEPTVEDLDGSNDPFNENSDVVDDSDDIVISDPDEQKSATQEPSSEESVESETKSEPEEEPTVDEVVDESSQHEKKKSSDAENMPESNVDLSEVFNFGKR